MRERQIEIVVSREYVHRVNVECRGFANRPMEGVVGNDARVNSLDSRQDLYIQRRFRFSELDDGCAIRDRVTASALDLNGSNWPSKCLVGKCVTLTTRRTRSCFRKEI